MAVMAFHDLRDFLQALEARGRLRRVSQVVDPELESTSLCLRAQRARGPALLFEQPRGSSHALLGNLFGHRERIEAALAGRPLASLRELGELLASLKEPRWPSSLREALIAWPEFAQLAPDRNTYVVRDMPTTKGGSALDVLRTVPAVDVDLDNLVSFRGNSGPRAPS